MRSIINLLTHRCGIQGLASKACVKKTVKKGV